MNLDYRFVVVWPQRQTFVRHLLQLQNRSLLRADVRRPAESSLGGDAPSLRKCLLEDVARPAERSFGGDAPSLRKCLLGYVV